MRKLFLLIPLLTFALLAKADVIDITPTSPYDDHDNLRLALYYANPGDVIVLDNGTYREQDNYLYFDKNITVRAKAGTSPVVQIVTYAQVKDGANVRIEGIKFDGSQQGTNGNSYSYFFRFYDNSNTSLELENCEFYNIAQYVLFGDKNSHTNLLKVNNCYFHNNTKNTIYFEASETAGRQTCDRLVVTNSTIANTAALTNYTSTIDIRPYGSDVTNAIKVIIDHCTFYNNPTINSDHSAIRPYKLSDVTISNCIFAHPDAYERRATCCYGGTISNCLTYNLTTDASQNAHRQSGGLPVLSGNFTADPLFNDLANNKYTFTNNWVTMNLSPAICAATDGSDLGDPRWHTAGTLPSTDFASPGYFLDGLHAKLIGRVALDANNYIKQNNNENAKSDEWGIAIWKVLATSPAVLKVTLNMDPDATASGHNYQVEIFDAEGNSKGALSEGGWYNNVDDKELTGTIILPASGDYKVVLTDNQEWSTSTIKGVTLLTTGGAVQALPGTVEVADAWFSSNGTRADGKITFPGSTIQDGWVKWNVSIANAANYNVTVNVNNTAGHNYSVALYRNESDPDPIVVGEGGNKYTAGTPNAIELGAMTVPAGSYIMKVTNATQNSDAALLSVQFAYAGGAAIDLSKTTPASLLANADAILSDDWSIESGKIVHAESKALTGWAKWNVDCADAGIYNVIVNIESDNSHLVRVEVFEDENDPAIFTLNETDATKDKTGAQVIKLGNITLEDKEYVFKVSNTLQYSHVKIASIDVAYAGGGIVNIPGTIALSEALLSTNAYRDADGLHFSDADHQSAISAEWAKWNIHATAGVYTFTFGVNSSNHGSYVITVFDGDDNIFSESYGKTGEGSYTTGPIYLEGDYVVQMQNTNNYSDGYLTSLSAAAASDVLIVDEMATDMQYITDLNGQSRKPLLKRSFKANMYNTVIFPFNGVSDAELTTIFGAGYELLAMTSAVLEDNTLNLNFTAVDLSQNTYGTPYLIKPTQDVVNPMFSSKTIYASTSHLTQSSTNADFIGSYVKGEVPAGENNLFLGQNNLLYFSDYATPIKGMRAYFQVKGVPHPSQAIKHANIIANDQVVTSIDFTKGENNKVMKAIENGQLIIIRNGERFTVQGQRIQ